LYLIQSGNWALAVDAVRGRYLSEGHQTVNPPTEIEADGERMAAALLIPMRRNDVEAGFKRWLHHVQTGQKRGQSDERRERVEV
jgi:hypothetical protein